MPNTMTMPNEYTAELQAIEKRRRMAEMLQNQALMPIGAPQTTNGIPGQNSWTQVAAKLLEGYNAGQMDRKATEDTKALSNRYKLEGQDALAKGLQAMQGTPAKPMVDESGIPYGGTDVPAAVPAVAPDRLAAMQAFSSHPNTAPASAAILAHMLKGEDPYNLREGETRYGPNGRVIAQNVKTQPGFTAKPGDSRFDASGKLIVAIPEKVDPNKPFLGVDKPNIPYQEYELKKAATGANRTNVSVDTRAEGQYANTVAGAAGKRDELQHQAAQAAPAALSKLDETLKELKTGKSLTGMGSGLLKEMERAKVLIAKDKAAGKVVTDTEYLDSLLGSDVFPLIQQLGIGARGMDTPAEREFLRAVMTGTTNLNKDTLIKMTESRRKNAQRALDSWNNRVKKGEVDDYFNYAKLPKETIEYGQSAPAPSTLPSQDAIAAELARRRK